MRPIAAILEKAYPSVVVEADEVHRGVFGPLKTSDVCDRSDDAAAMFEGEDESEWPWEEGALPISKLSKFVLKAKSLAGDKGRMQTIKTWIDKEHRGDAFAATRQSPLIMIKRQKGTYELVDGFHRLAEAAVRGAKQVYVIIAHEPEGYVAESREVALAKGLLLEAAFTAQDIDLDKTYGTFKASYEKQTGKAWDKEKFLERIQNWTLYGDHDGFVAARQQASGPIKLVGAAGNPIGVKKGFQELLAGSKPVWGAMDLRLATMAARMGMKMPPAWIMTKVLSAIKDKFAAASGLPGSAVTVNKDGSLTIDYPDVGKATKFVVGNKSYFEWLLKTQGAAIPAMLRTAISYFLTTGKPPPEPKDQDDNEAFALEDPVRKEQPAS